MNMSGAKVNSHEELQQVAADTATVVAGASGAWAAWHTWIGTANEILTLVGAALAIVSASYAIRYYRRHTPPKKDDE